MATPMERLLWLVPEVPQAFENGPWARVERRGSLALLKAMPEGIRTELVATRSMGSIAILFAIFRIFQPGGLGERSALLKHLAEARAPNEVGEWTTALRNWRRWLVLLRELNIQVRDPVLLMASLDRFAVVLAKRSTEVAFRLRVAKAALQVDVIPTMQGVARFTQMLLAEGEAARHRVCCGVDPEVKVRALDVNHSNSDAEGTTSDRENGEGGESGIEEPELAPCSGSANGEDDGSQSDGVGSGSEGPDAATPSEENGGGGTDNERSVMPVCRYFRGGVRM